jgi:hypothetical protein
MSLILAGVFIVTFLVVCLIAYLVLSKRGADSKRPLTPRAAAATSARVGYGRSRAAHVGGSTREPGPYPPGTARMTRPGSLTTVFALVMTFAVMCGVVYGAVTAVNHLDALSFLFRGVPAVPRRFQWAIPLVLAAAILAVGLPLARRFRRPDRFRSGVVLVALAFATFWPLQLLAGSFDLPFWEYDALLHVLAVFVSLCLLSGARTRKPPKHSLGIHWWASVQRIALKLRAGAAIIKMGVLRRMWPSQPNSFKRRLGSALKGVDGTRLAQLVGQR